jgi:hypothetical protein
MCLNQIACGAGKSTGGSAPPAQVNEVANKKAEVMKIRITIGEKVVTASLADIDAARDFVSLLPLTLTLEDYAKTEKTAICRESYLRRAHTRAATRLSEILPTTLLGESGDLLQRFRVLKRTRHPRKDRRRRGSIQRAWLGKDNRRAC